MGDVKDILGMSRGPAEKVEAPKPKKEKMKRPEGMSREAYALLGDSHPIMATQLAAASKKDVKAKPKPSTKGIVTWTYQPINNSARTDGFQVFHWSKGFKDAAGRMKEPDDPDYYYAKFNKKVQLIKYNDEEYDSLLAPHSGNWSKEETNYLLQLCEQFDLRFIVIADRYDWLSRLGPQALRVGAAQPRGLDDLKERYYSIARRLLVAREGSEAPVANQVLVKHPFNKAAEIERKKAIEAMLKRTHAQVAEDNAVLAEAKAIEERRRTETAARGRVTNAPTSNHAQQSGAGQVGNAGRTTASAPGAGTPGPGALEIRFPERLPNDPGPGMPSLLDANLQPFRPVKPGVVARGTHTVGLYNTMLANLSGGPKAQKAVETALIELGGIPALSGPKHCSRAVTGAWLALRTELFTLQDLRRQLPGRAGLGLGGEPKSKKRRN